MKKQQLKEYIIAKAVEERHTFHTFEQWSKEYFQENKKDQAREWAQSADVSRARWSVYVDLINMLGAQEEYYKAS